MSEPRNKVVPIALVVLSLAALAAVGLFGYVAFRKEASPALVSGSSQQVSARAPLSYAGEPVGFPMQGNPVITHVLIADVDQDGLNDILVCDGGQNFLGWIRQYPTNVFTEQRLGEPIPGPAHVSIADVNGDARPDLLVASMGVILPNNDRLGRVIVLENQGGGAFQTRVLAENIARVTDVRGADVNGDGRVDLVVGQFGFDQGEIRWRENLGEWNFRSQVLLSVPGTITTPVADFDRDGNVDFAAMISQDKEEVRLFRNVGQGQFLPSLLWKGKDDSWASSGLEVADLNKDGYPDLLYSNGDGFSSGFTEPAPWHGLQWFENRNGQMVYHRIGDMPGCYSPVAADLDGDGDMDIVAVSAFNHVIDPSAVWMTAWMNDGKQTFTPVPIAHEPTRLITVAAGDLDGDGIPELVTGGFHAYPPFRHMSRIMLWRKR